MVPSDACPVGMEGIIGLIREKVREDFANAIALPGSLAGLIGPDNKRNGRSVPIAEAVSMGCAFSVQVAPHILAFDADTPKQVAAVYRLAEQAVVRGLQPSFWSRDGSVISISCSASMTAVSDQS